MEENSALLAYLIEALGSRSERTKERQLRRRLCCEHCECDPYVWDSDGNKVSDWNDEVCLHCARECECEREEKDGEAGPTVEVAGWIDGVLGGNGPVCV